MKKNKNVFIIMDNSINLLNKKIELLKHNIQDVINKQSNNVTDESVENEKQLYISELNKTINDLKDTKLQITRNNELKRVSRITESMLYYRVKNKHNSNELMQELKDNREVAQDNFEKMKKIEMKYTEKESLESDMIVPGFLFFHKTIMDKYNLCPFIKISDEDDINDIIRNRKSWLQSQDDNGCTYYDLYDKIIRKTTLNDLNLHKKNMEDDFDKTYNDVFTKEQYGVYSLICENIIDYKTYTIKTKKLKDKFKIIINNVTNLVMETNLNINEYMSLYYDLFIPVNIPITKKIEEDKKIDGDMFFYNLYEDKLDKYKTVIEEIKSSTKYIINTEIYLKQNLYEYLFNDTKIKSAKQVGKYFKKWSLLNDDEKKERYESFSNYFVDKYLVEPNLIDNDQSGILKTNLKNLLITEFKNIKYKNLKWDIKRGNLDQIYTLKYDSDKNEFYIKILENIVKVNKPKKQVSIKTILNKDNEKIINEEIVVFIINLKNNNTLESNIDASSIKLLKDDCIEQIKTKMLLKRITVNDKLQIHKKFDEIFNIILHNSN